MKSLPSHSPIIWSRRQFLRNSIASAFAIPLAAQSADPDTKAIRVGICRSWSEHKRLMELGFDFCEDNVRRLLVPDKPDETFENSAATVSPSDFPIRSCNGFFPEQIKLVGPQVDADRAVNWAATACRRAARLKIPVLVLGSGGARRIPDGFARGEAERQFVELARRMGRAASAHGVVIAVESLNRGETNFLNRLTEVAEVVREVGEPGFQGVADLYHMAREDEGPDSLANAAGCVRHCHIAEKAKRTAPGTDGDDFRPYFRELKRAGYAGVLSLECGWQEFERQAPDAIRVIRTQWAEA